MMLTFNNGLGLLLVVNEEETDEILLRLKAMGETAYCIGTIESREEGEDPVQFTGPGI
jgi:phosphoribosylaminoimidazole (AIR) synthetase